MIYFFGESRRLSDGVGQLLWFQIPSDRSQVLIHEAFNPKVVPLRHISAGLEERGIKLIAGKSLRVKEAIFGQTLSGFLGLDDFREVGYREGGPSKEAEAVHQTGMLAI